MARRTAAQAAQTRHELVDAAVDVFSECGYAGATLERIADRAGVTRGALYHHFHDKADVYETVLRRQADQVAGPLMDALTDDGPPLQRIRDFLVAYCTALERDARFRRAVDLLLFGAAGAPQLAQERTRRGYETWLRAFEAVFGEAGERGELRRAITPDAAARTLLALTVGATTAALRAPHLFSSAEHAESLANTLIAGLTP
jgi:TetR/AcrR family acrAB operon transcriptional repressor